MIKYTVKNNILYPFLSLLVFFTVLSGGFPFVVSCTKQDLQDRVTTGLLSIYLEWGTTPPLDMLFYFYPLSKEGTIQGTPLVYTCNSRAFEQRLPPGDYKILLCAADAPGVIYEEMDNLSTARVCAVKQDEIGCVAQPSGVFAANTCHHADILHIDAADTLVTGITPVPLTKTVTFEFSLKNVPSVTAVSGRLHGVVSAINLFDGKQEPTPCSHMFTANYTEGTHTAAIHIFNFITGQEATPAPNTNTLQLHLKGKAGEDYNVKVDISKTIHEIKQANNGLIPINISISLELVLIGGNIQASVSRWTNGSGSGSVN